MSGRWVLAPDVAGRLQELREATGWTQLELASIAGRRNSSVSSWERGVTKPTRGLLERLCERFGWPIAMFGKGGPRPKDMIKGPISLERALGTGGDVEFAVMPKVENRPVKEVYVLGVNDVMEWGVLSAAYKAPAQRAMRWLDAMKDAATKERDEASRARDLREQTLLDELSIAKGEAERLRSLSVPDSKRRPG